MGVLPLFYIYSPWFDFAEVPFEMPLDLGGTVLFVVAIWLFYRSSADQGKEWSPTVEFEDAHVLGTSPDRIRKNLI